MIFNFAICDYEGCQNWYFDVDDNVTRDEIIEKIHEGFRNYVKKELDEDNKRPLKNKKYCTEKQEIYAFSHHRKLDKEFEKVGLKVVKLQHYNMFEDDDVYTTLGMEAKCRGTENCQKEYCDKVDWWKEEKDRWKRRIKEKYFSDKREDLI